MINVVTTYNRNRFHAPLDAMHRDRKRIFVDWLKWDIPVVDGIYEKDQFDTEDAIYLLALDPGRNRHLGSVRLLPSTKPHLLGSVFPYLCEDGVPVGEDIWEITRLCTAPGLKDDAAKQMRRQIATGLVEFGLLYGINKYTCVAHLQWLSQLLAAGWECEPLGPPQEIGGEMVGAMAIGVSPATLQLFRSRFGMRSPVLEIEAIAEAA